MNDMGVHVCSLCDSVAVCVCNVNVCVCGCML